ncbi:hypothetical protein LINPERHAP2_LOCUS11352 [Linum perenne]
MAQYCKPPLTISSSSFSSPTTATASTTSSSASHSRLPTKTIRLPPPRPQFSPFFPKPFTCYSWRRGRYTAAEDEEEDDDDDNFPGPASATFDAAVNQFNRRQYYECHDSLEALWMRAENDRSRTLFHGILQCAVGFHHLFNQNHKGAMMELGEGLCKLRKMNFSRGPFRRFEEEISAVLDFIYLTQLQLAACSEDICLAMDQTEISYQLLGGYGAGQQIYSLGKDEQSGEVVGETFLKFLPPTSSTGGVDTMKLKLPTLDVTHEHLLAVSR